MLCLVSSRRILLLCHFLVVVELDLLDDNKIEPIDILSHLAVLAHHLPTGVVLGALKLSQPLLLLHVHLSMFASFEALGNASVRLLLGETLELLKRLRARLHDPNVGLDKLGEVGEERVRRLEEIEPWIPYLPLGQALQELVAVFGHELGRELDCLDLFVGQRDVVDLKLIGRRRLNLLKHVHFLPRLDLLSQLCLEIIIICCTSVSTISIIIASFTVVVEFIFLLPYQTTILIDCLRLL